MTTLINKSNHPVNIKKINVRVWTLRDEIEACIQKRIEEQGSENVDIEDIKAFYSSLTPKNTLSDELDDDQDDLNHQPGIEDTSEMEEDDGENEAEDSEANDEPKDEAGDESEKQETAEDAETQAREMAGEVLNEEAEREGQESGSASPKQSFRRVKPSPDKMVHGFAFLSEVHMDQILFFGKRSYTNGQSIIVEFLIPNTFSISAEVVSSMHIDRSSRIISDTKPSHRVQGDFTFLFDGERGNLREFLKSVEPSVPPPPKKLKKQDTDGDDDEDFDDLGF